MSPITLSTPRKNAFYILKITLSATPLTCTVFSSSFVRKQIIEDQHLEPLLESQRNSLAQLYQYIHERRATS